MILLIVACPCRQATASLNKVAELLPEDTLESKYVPMVARLVTGLFMGHA